MEPYQIIMLLLGGLLFLTCLIGIIISMVRNQSMKKYIPFLCIAIVMIGFPAIKKVSIMNDLVTLEKYSKEYEANPSDPEALKKLTESFDNVNTNKITTSKQLTIYARGALLLGRNEISINYADKALDKDKSSVQARDIKLLAESNMMVRQLMLEPGNGNLRSELNRKLRVLEERPDKTSFESLKMAEGQLIAGNTVKAKEEANQVIARNPGDFQARQIIQLAGVEDKIREAERNPENNNELSQAVQSFQALPASPEQNVYRNAIMAKAFRTLGEEEKSRKYFDSVRVNLRPVR